MKMASCSISAPESLLLPSAFWNPTRIVNYLMTKVQFNPWSLPRQKKKYFIKSFRDLFLHPSSLTLKPNRNWEKIKLWKYVFLQITSQPKKRPPGGALVSVRSSALRILPQLEILHLQGQDGLGTKGPGRNVNQPLMFKLFTSIPTYPSKSTPLHF